MSFLIARRQIILCLSLLVFLANGVTSRILWADDPLVFDEKIGHYRDLSYQVLTDEGLSWTQRTSLFGGETVHYGELSDGERVAKEMELKNFRYYSFTLASTTKLRSECPQFIIQNF